MTDEQIQQLDPNESAILSEEDQIIAAKRAKKKNIPLEVSEEARRQELNAKKAQQLTIEYNDKLNALGFALQPKINVLTDAIVATFQLRPLSAEEMKSFNETKGKKDQESVSDVPKTEEVAN